MFKLAKPFFIIVKTPLHAGSGNDLGIVDMPIQRERHTDFPKIEGSSLKGAVREVFEEYLTLENENKDYKINLGNEKIKQLIKLFPDLPKQWEIKKEGEETKIRQDKECNRMIKFNETLFLTFGPEGSDDAHSGALGFTDARLLLFPVKSMKGVFSWVTCPKVLKRFKSDLKLSKINKNNFFNDKSIPAENTIADLGHLAINGKIILEEYTFEVTYKESTGKFAEWLSNKTGQEDIKKRLVVLPDDDFRDFVNLSTEVITRTKINSKTGTVKSGMLFTEEYLPAETIMYSLALASPIFKEKDSEKGVFALKEGERSKKKTLEEDKVMEFFTGGIPEVMQIGGNATIGKGIAGIKIWEEQEDA